MGLRRQAFLILMLVPVVAAAVLLAALWIVKDESTGVAVPTMIVVGFVVIMTAAVSVSAAARDIRAAQDGPRERSDEPRPPADDNSLSVAQSAVLLATFVVLTAVPAGVVVGAVTLLDSVGNLQNEFILPLVLLVGLIGLLAVLAMIVAVFQRFDLVNRAFALGLPEGSIQAVIAISLILIFAIIGVYLHGAMPAGEGRDDLSQQLLTTISTLVVAVAGFYFGSKSTQEATHRALPGGTVTVGGEPGGTSGGEGTATGETTRDAGNGGTSPPPAALT